MGKPKRIEIIFSYHPMLDLDGTGLDPGQGITPQQLAKVSANCLDGIAFGLSWIVDDIGRLIPLFIFERGMDIGKHLVKWSEELPTEFFEVAYIDNDDYYLIMLKPNFDRIIQRYKLTRLVIADELSPPDSEYHIITRPVECYMKISDHYRQFKKQNQKQTMVGFVDRAALDIGTSHIDLNRMMLLGPFNVAASNTIATQFKNWQKE